MQVDMYPQERGLAMTGRYEIANKTSAPIGRVYISQHRESDIRSLRFGQKVTRTIDDPSTGFYGYTLSRPMQPGERMVIEFEIAYSPKGILGGGLDTPVIYNGSFFSSAPRRSFS